MTNTRSKRFRLRLGGRTGIIVILVLAALVLLSYMRRPRLTPELRGSELAATLGCHACHGPGGTGGIPNPKSEDKEIPSWDGGTAMMYVENEQEIREWILDGHPARLAESHDHDPDETGLPIEMPAYRELLSDDELEDLVAYYIAVANYRDMPANVTEGYRVAARLGCFGCHGPGGLIGSKNPRSFKGYIPPWRGNDFRELVKSERELRDWILDGAVDRFEGNRIARFFTDRQTIQMPAYRDELRDGELDSLVAYINWLSEE